MTSRKKPKKSPARKKAKPKKKAAAQPKTPVKMGRPSAYTQEIAEKICTQLAEGISLREICRQEGMPSMSMVFRWIFARDDFREQYTLAREIQADTLFDDTLDIADNATNDWMERHNKDGELIGWFENGEAIKRSQLRIDTRKWIAGKLRPKKYGEKSEQDVTVTQRFVVRGPPTIEDDEEWLAKHAPKLING